MASASAAGLALPDAIVHITPPPSATSVVEELSHGTDREPRCRGRAPHYSSPRSPAPWIPSLLQFSSSLSEPNHLLLIFLQVLSMILYHVVPHGAVDWHKQVFDKMLHHRRPSS